MAAAMEVKQNFEARLRTIINAIEAIRENADISQAQSTSKMIRRGMRMQESLQVENNATLRIPDVDRGPSDPKNLLYSD